MEDITNIELQYKWNLGLLKHMKEIQAKVYLASDLNTNKREDTYDGKQS